MKKVIFYALVCLLPFFFACSSSDSDELSIDNDKVVYLYSGDEHLILVSNDNPVTFTSGSDFVASVSDDGYITARKVGETNVYVSDGKHVENVEVHVVPKYKIYDDPCTDFGISRKELIAKLGEPDQENGGTLGYFDESKKAPITMYMFEDDKLKGCCVIVRSEFSGELGSFLTERYQPYMDQQSAEFTLYFFNEDMSMAIGTKLYQTSAWMVLYAPIGNKK